MVKMKTVDQLFISSAGADTMPPGTEFDVSAEEADRLEKEGLANRVGAKAEKEAPANKAEQAAPENKSVAKKIIGAEGLTRTASRSAKPKGKK